MMIIKVPEILYVEPKPRHACRDKRRDVHPARPFPNPFRSDLPEEWLPPLDRSDQRRISLHGKPQWREPSPIRFHGRYVAFAGAPGGHDVTFATLRAALLIHKHHRANRSF